MNNKQKLKLFWKVIRLLNVALIKEKFKPVQINKIVFFQFRKHSPSAIGFYRCRDKLIGINQNIFLTSQLETLIHEFCHGLQHQNKINLFHNQKFKNLTEAFLKILNDHIRIKFL